MNDFSNSLKFTPELGSKDVPRPQSHVPISAAQHVPRAQACGHRAA